MNQIKNKNILLVDDDDSIRWVINELLSDLGHTTTQTRSAEEAIALLNNHQYDLLITDVRMTGKSGMELLSYCQKICTTMPVIIITAHADLDSAVNAYKEGAFEYLPKPFDLDEVAATVNRALTSAQFNNVTEQSSIEPKDIDFKDTNSKENKYAIIGEAPAMQNLYRAIGRLSNSQTTVLIQGESGTGKELVAHAIHQSSPRNHKPFIALNMAAIPKDLIESELFGYEKGSYTGANARYLGRFEQANHGTLFLDEIGDMPLETQTRLLRVLSEKAFYRIGASQPTQVDVRIITATHQNLHEKVAQGEFREDLYHRLNVIPLQLPPLRERKEDIPRLSQYFLNQISQEIKQPKKTFSNETLKKLQDYHWPGNVRQLENICKRLSVMVNSQNILTQDLPTEILSLDKQLDSHNSWEKSLNNQLIKEYQEGNDQVFINIQSEVEQLIINAALNSTSGKKIEAAKLLGWGRNTLTRKLKK